MNRDKDKMNPYDADGNAPHTSMDKLIGGSPGSDKTLAEVEEFGRSLHLEHEANARLENLDVELGFSSEEAVKTPSTHDLESHVPVPMRITKRGEISGSQKRVLTGGHKSGDLRQGKVGRKRVKTSAVRSGESVDALLKKKEAKDIDRRGW